MIKVNHYYNPNPNLFNNLLFLYRHFDVNSDLLFNMVTSSIFLITKAFSRVAVINKGVTFDTFSN